MTLTTRVVPCLVQDLFNKSSLSVVRSFSPGKRSKTAWPTNAGVQGCVSSRCQCGLSLRGLGLILMKHTAWMGSGIHVRRENNKQQPATFVSSQTFLSDFS